MLSCPCPKAHASGNTDARSRFTPRYSAVCKSVFRAYRLISVHAITIFRILIAALISRSWCAAHAGQFHSRTFGHVKKLEAVWLRRRSSCLYKERDIPRFYLRLRVHHSFVFIPGFIHPFLPHPFVLLLQSEQAAVYRARPAQDIIKRL